MVVEALKQTGPCLSSVLTGRLAGTGVTRETARKRLSRALAQGTVEVVKGLTFAHGATFVYLPQQRKKLDFARNLKDAILDAGGAYARAIIAVQARRVIPVWQFPAACAAPLMRTKQLTPTQVLERLVEVGVFLLKDVPGIGPAVAMADRSHAIPTADITGAMARLATESLLLDMVREWSRRLGVSSWEATRFRHRTRPVPEVGSFAWDMTSPSYLLPLARWSANGRMPGFFVCDVLLGGTVREGAASVFRHKCGELRHLKVAPVLALFVADGYQKKAFNQLKEDGIIPATIKSLFGVDAAEAFGALAKVLTEALAGNLDAPALADIVRRLAKVEGALGNLQGALFEYLVAEIIRHQEPGVPLEMNRHIKDAKGNDVEVDIWAFARKRTARFFECKGREPGSEINDAEIDRWLDKRIPAIRHYLDGVAAIDGDQQPRPSFELWATGRLSERSARRIERTREANKRVFDLVVVNAVGVQDAARKADNKPLIDTLEQLFKDAPG
jgi:hypothetical protein